MAAEVSLPSPETTLVVLLGASSWPSFPGFQSSPAFTNASLGLKEYFLDPQKFSLPPENLLDLFDSEVTAPDIDERIGEFLDQRISSMKATGLEARDLVIHFVGQSGFAGADSEYFLAIRRTREANPITSGIPISSLAFTLKKKARYLRRIVILDTCFAAAAFSAFQATPTQVAVKKAIEAFGVPGKGVGIPRRGTAFLCSSSSKSPSLLLPDESSTMFSAGLLNALSNGDPHLPEYMSLREIGNLITDFLHTSFDSQAPSIELHSPEQSEGDVALVAFFPNPSSLRQSQESPQPTNQQSIEEPRSNQAKEPLVEVDAVPWHLDRPAQIDELGRQSFAAALAQRIRNIQGEEKEVGSFILHIHGSWGSGKSSLLGFLGEELKYGSNSPRHKRNPSWIVINFNAWMHQRLGSPWWWLMNALFQQSARQLWKINPWGSIKLRIYQFIWRFLRAGWPPYLVAFMVLAAIFWLIHFNDLFDLLNFGSSQAAVGANTVSLKPLADIAQSASAIIALIITIWGLIFGLSRSLLQGSARAATILMESSRDPMKAITDHFNGLVHKIQKPVAIFIDDLDRCQNDYIVELLEGIQTLFISAPVTFVIAADKYWLYVSYEKMYETFSHTLEETGRPLGYLFLEKAFQLSASVPPMSQAIQNQFWLRLVQADSSDYVEKLQKAQKDAEQKLQEKTTEHEILGEVERVVREGDAIAEQAVRQAAVERLAAPAVEIHTEHALKSFAPLLEPNPRSMKRFVNTYYIHRSIATLTGISLGMKELALWTIVVLRWPLLAEFLEDHPDMITYLIKISLGDTELPDIPAHLSQLFQSESVRNIMRGKNIGVSLNEDVIRRCAHLHASDSCMRWKDR